VSAAKALPVMANPRSVKTERAVIKVFRLLQLIVTSRFFWLRASLAQ
jgi:hypothetical protein